MLCRVRKHYGSLDGALGSIVSVKQYSLLSALNL